MNQEHKDEKELRASLLWASCAMHHVAMHGTLAEVVAMESGDQEEVQALNDRHEKTIRKIFETTLQAYRELAMKRHMASTGGALSLLPQPSEN